MSLPPVQWMLRETNAGSFNGILVALPVSLALAAIGLSIGTLRVQRVGA